MMFDPPLLPATLIRRYKRFLCDVRLPSGQEVTAHCANSGAMTGLLEPGAPILLSPAKGKPGAKGGKAKLPYAWEMVQVGAGWVVVHTGRANALAAEAIAAGRIPELAGYESLRREVRFGQASRVDLLLESPQHPTCYVEVKSVTLKRATAAGEGLALFPDAVTLRGRKHLVELAAQAQAGCRAVMLYLVQRTDCDYFSIAADIDPAYGAAFSQATAQGVEVLAYECHPGPQGLAVSRRLPLVAMGYPGGVSWDGHAPERID